MTDPLQAAAERDLEDAIDSLRDGLVAANAAAHEVLDITQPTDEDVEHSTLLWCGTIVTEMNNLCTAKLRVVVAVIDVLIGIAEPGEPPEKRDTARSTAH